MKEGQNVPFDIKNLRYCDIFIVVSVFNMKPPVRLLVVRSIYTHLYIYHIFYTLYLLRKYLFLYGPFAFYFKLLDFLAKY